jgi:hypothetical protein
MVMDKTDEVKHGPMVDVLTTNDDSYADCCYFLCLLLQAHSTWAMNSVDTLVHQFTGIPIAADRLFGQPVAFVGVAPNLNDLYEAYFPAGCEVHGLHAVGTTQLEAAQNVVRQSYMKQRPEFASVRDYYGAAN